MWMAPNMVTFIGWIFVILSYSVMLFYDYTFTKIIPSWTFLFAAVSLFIYSTLDAIDGKQARRTNSSSPLGQLFDHGCDSFSMSFFVLAACQAVRLEPHGIFFVFMAAQVTWWSSNWLEYQTGVLKTNVGGFGVTETELICIVIHLLTGLFGQEMWDISLGGLSLKEIVVYFVAVTLLALCAYSYASLLLASSPEKRTEMLLQVSSLVGLLIIEYIWMKLLIYDSYNGIILLNFGIFLSLSICKIIVSSVTKMELEKYNQEMTTFLVATALMLLFEALGSLRGQTIVFWICFAVNLTETLVFLSRTIIQITDYLGIYCFSLQKKPRKLD